MMGMLLAAWVGSAGVFSVPGPGAEAAGPHRQKEAQRDRKRVLREKALAALTWFMGRAAEWA